MYLGKRISITTLMGIIGGAAAVGMTLGIGASLSQEVIFRMLLNFGLLGFVIGISRLGWHWLLHGLFFGTVLGLLEGLASAATGLPIFIPLVYGMLVGVLIEFVATSIFKSGNRPVQASTAI